MWFDTGVNVTQDCRQQKQTDIFFVISTPHDLHFLAILSSPHSLFTLFNTRLLEKTSHNPLKLISTT